MPVRRWWTEAEVIALEAGVKRHGAGKWVYILRDLDFGPHLRGVLTRFVLETKCDLFALQCIDWKLANCCFPLFFSGRTNIDLKDKWRSLQVKKGGFGLYFPLFWPIFPSFFCTTRGILVRE